MKKLVDKFTILLLNYNNYDYLFEAIDSVIKQDYPNIELIIVDDCSSVFYEEKIDDYLRKYAKNINSYKIVRNKKNLGTVKTINFILKNVNSKYMMLFASDDALSDNKIITKYYNALKNKNCNIVTSQWLICDDNLIVKGKYINSIKGNLLNILPLKYQLYYMCNRNLYGSGSTAYRLSTIKKYNYFDEKYKYLEDWPFWINLIKNGEKIFYINENGLLHRSGGVSDENKESSEARKLFYHEILLTFHDEIIPIINSFSFFKKYKILKRYRENIVEYGKYIDTEKYIRNYNEHMTNIYKIFVNVEKLIPNITNKIIILYKYNKQVLFSTIMTIISQLFIHGFFENKFWILISFIIEYAILYYIIGVVSRIQSIIKKVSKK